MAGIACQNKAVDHLLKNNIVRITAPLFLDENFEVKKNALGAMRSVGRDCFFKYIYIS